MGYRKKEHRIMLREYEMKDKLQRRKRISGVELHIPNHIKTVQQNKQ